MPEPFPHKYGLVLPVQLPDHLLELYCFKIDHPPSRGGLGKYRHFLNASRMILPEVKLNDWGRDQLRSLCQTEHAIRLGNVIHRFVYWPGCAASGKTFTSGHYAFLWWLSDPAVSTVILTSTSGKMVKTRGWHSIQEFFFQAKRALSEKFKIDQSQVNCGNLVDSQMILQSKKGDSLCAIMGLSVEPGELGKTVAKLQGIHNERILLIVDEATDTPEAIFRVIQNLSKGCSDLTVLLIGNPTSRTLDPFDRACQPVGGWETVDLEDIEWAAKGDKELCLEPGLTVRFRGKESPNVRAKKTIFPFLYTWEDFQFAQGKEDTIEYWKWTEGFPPPAGVCNTVMDEVMISKYDGRGKHIFLSQAIPIAGLDPAFGGDRCILQFGLLGDLTAGKMGIQITETIEIKTLATSEHEVDFQIAQQTIMECKKRGVTIDYLGVDATGTGRGVYSHLTSDWGRCVRVEFGGAASEMPASIEDPRPSCDIYDRCVTELHYSCKELLVAGQLKGLSQEAVNEFCFRTYEIRSRKTRLQTKEEMKKKYGKSPDHSDAVAVLCRVARLRGASTQTVLKESGDWEKTVREINKVYEDVDYSPEVQVEEGNYEQDYDPFY